MKQEAKRGPGRPYKPATKILIASSMGQAAGLLRCPKEWLSYIKEAGCPAFRSTRVYLPELREWLQGKHTNAKLRHLLHPDNVDRLRLLLGLYIEV